MISTKYIRPLRQSDIHRSVAVVTKPSYRFILIVDKYADIKVHPMHVYEFINLARTWPP
jgi:hypothetical protein